VLLTVCVLAGVAAYLLARSFYGSLPPLPRLAPVSIIVVAVVEAALAVTTRNRMAGRVRARALDPLLVARYAALAKASSLAGALVGGAYAGFLGYVLPLRQAAEPRSDAWTAAAGLGAGLALTVAAYALERVCRIKRPPPGPPPGPA
jgi:hypothetical protein